MSSESPDIVIYDVNGNPLAIQNNTVLPASISGLIVAGSDGTDARFLAVNSSGQQIIVGAGTAGTSTGGVLSIQGVSGGVAVTVSGTVTATNPSVSTPAAAVPTSATYVGGQVQNLQSGLTTGDLYPLSLTTAGLLRVDGSNVTQPVSGTVTANAGTGNFTVIGAGTAGTANSGVVTIQGIASMTPVQVSQATAANLNATVVGTVTSNQGTANTLANAWSAKITDGTNGPVAVKPASTAAVATDSALVVAISPNNSITASNPSVTTTGSAPPGSATYIGGSVTTYPPSYTTGQMSGLSLTTGGLLRTAAVIDPDLTVIHNNATITTSGSAVITGVGRKEISFGLTISGTVSGTTPSLTYTVFEIDPVNQSTVMTAPGNSITVGPYTTTGHTNYLQMISYTGAIKVSWTVTGTTPSFGGVDSWIVVKEQSSSFGLTYTGTTNPLSVVNIDANNNTIVVGSGTAGTPAGGVLTVQGVSGGTSLPTTLSDVTSTGTLGALNAAVQVVTAGLTTAGFQLAAGTLIGTIIPEVSFDGGTTWVSTYFDTPANGKVSTIVFSTSNTATAATIVGVGGSGISRVRVSAYTSGTANITLRATTRTDPSVLFAGPAAVAGPPSVAQIGGSVTTSSPSYTTGTLNTLSLNTSGGLRVDGSAVTQPVSGTVAATQSGTWTVQPGNTANTTPWLTTINQGGNSAVVAAASTAVATANPALAVGLSPNSPLPAGTNTIGALAANQTVNLNQVGGTSVVTGGVAGSQGIGGLAAAGAVPAGNPVLVAGSDGTDVRTLSTDSTGRLSTKAICNTGTCTSVTASTSTVTLLAVNTSRIGAVIYNASTATCYVKFSSAASTTSYTVQIGANGYFEVPFGYTGIITAVWSAVNGNAQITEMT